MTIVPTTKPIGKTNETRAVLVSELASLISMLMLPPIRALSLAVSGAVTAASATIATIGCTGAMSTSRGTAAAAGSTQANATALPASVDNFSITAANGTKGVRLPTATGGRRIFVKNTENAVLKVYPASGAAVNEAAANAAYSMAAYTSAFFVGDSATKWYTCPLVAS